MGERLKHRVSLPLLLLLLVATSTALFADDLPVASRLGIRPDTYTPAAYEIAGPLPFRAQGLAQRVSGQNHSLDLYSEEIIHLWVKHWNEQPPAARPAWQTAGADVWSGEPAASPGRLFYLHFMTPDPGGVPPRRITYTLVVLAEDFFMSGVHGQDVLSGRVEARGGKFFVSVRGSYGSSVGLFRGEVTLEEPFQPTSYIFSGGVFLTRFVLSSSADCGPFLKVSDAQGN